MVELCDKIHEIERLDDWVDEQRNEYELVVLLSEGLVSHITLGIEVTSSESVDTPAHIGERATTARNRRIRTRCKCKKNQMAVVSQAWNPLNL